MSLHVHDELPGGKMSPMFRGTEDPNCHICAVVSAGVIPEITEEAVTDAKSMMQRLFDSRSLREMGNTWALSGSAKPLTSPPEEGITRGGLVQGMERARTASRGMVIRTVSGRRVDLGAPDPDTIDAHDIAHHLAMICRFGGGVLAHYSVAEHSLNVANQLERLFQNPELTLAGLLHDGEEAYIGDMVSQLKHSDGMETYREVEGLLRVAINTKFELTMWDRPEIKAIDKEILPWEMAMVRDNMVRLDPDPADVREAFFARFSDLRYEIRRAKK